MANKALQFEFCGPEHVLRKQGPSEAEWDAQKGCISHLYRDESQTLKNVMAVMKRDYAFDATVKMYKTKIAKWGLDKKNKKKEVRAIIWKKSQRDAVGKDSVFTLRGQPVDIADVLRYARRKRLTSPTLSASPVSTPAELICYTPPTVPRSPRTPEGFRNTEQVFVHVQNYVRGCFDNRTWVSLSEAQVCSNIKRRSNIETSPVNALASNCLAANALYEFQSTEEINQGFELLSMGTANIKHVLEAQEPHALPLLFGLLILFEDSNRPEFNQLIIDQLSDMASMVLPSGHPFGQIWERLKRLDHVQRRDTVHRAWQSLSDIFEGILSPFHNYTLTCKLGHMAIAEKYRDSRANEEQLQVLSMACEQKYGPMDPRSLDIREELAFNLCFAQKRYAEAEEIAEGILKILLQTRGVLSESFRLARLTDALIILSSVQKGQRKLDLAISTLSQAINLRATSYGWNDAIVIDGQIDLERWLNESGRYAKAHAVRKQRIANLRPSNLHV